MQFLDDEEGVLEIVGSTSEALQAAKDTVVDIITEPEEGTIYRQVWHSILTLILLSALMSPEMVCCDAHGLLCVPSALHRACCIYAAGCRSGSRC